MLESVLAYVGIGSNLGDSPLMCKEALRHLSAAPGVKVERVSSLYKTQPVIVSPAQGPHMEVLQNQNWFINAAAEIRTAWSPAALLHVLQGIEEKLGKVRSFPGAPRIIDLDLLLYRQEIIREADLIVPHPQMHKRRFVLEPLCEIASYLIHPAFGVSMRGLKDRLDDRHEVEIFNIGKEG